MCSRSPAITGCRPEPARPCADELAARLPRRAWQRLPAGDGAEGSRYYDWAWVTINAGLRWAIEENFQAGKGITGLDQHQVRRRASWYRWVTLAMLACAVLPSQPPSSMPATPVRQTRSR